MKEIQLTQGKVALVDDEDFELLNSFKWCAHKRRHTYYACRNFRLNGKSATLYMHQAIMNFKGADHVDGEGLNNQRYNLRKCTQQENLLNKCTNKNGTSKYKGVDWIKRRSKWRARIKLNGRQTYIGEFANEDEAGMAYDERAKVLFGEFARLNFKQTA